MTKAEKEAKGQANGEPIRVTEVVKADGEKLTVGQFVYIGKQPEFANDAERVAFRQAHTFEVEFNFEGVTKRERMLQLVSQTTYRKMWYNNDVRPNTAPDKNGKIVWSNDKIEKLANGKQPAFQVSIRELLESRKKRVADPATKAKRAATDLKKYAEHLTPEQKAELMMMLDES